MATPQRAAISAPQLPTWVCKAWECRDQKQALFRVVSQNVPVEAMEAIQDLPGDWQLKRLQCLLIHKKNISDPIGYMKTFAAGYQGMPSSASLIPASVATPRGLGRPVAVLHLGKCTGFEMHALSISTERLLGE